MAWPCVMGRQGGEGGSAVQEAEEAVPDPDARTEQQTPGRGAAGADANSGGVQQGGAALENTGRCGTAASCFSRSLPVPLVRMPQTCLLRL